MADMAEIYRAMGYEVSEEGETITVQTSNTHVTQPVKIVVTVIPTGFEMDVSKTEEMIVNLRVLAIPTVTFEETPLGHRAHETDWDSSISLPISQIELYKETNGPKT